MLRPRYFHVDAACYAIILPRAYAMRGTPLI